MSGALQAVTMPKWGLSMSEGMVTAWHVEEGAAVAAGDDLADIETTKITNVLEAPHAGILRRRVVGEGETVPVGSLLAVFADAAVDDAEVDAFVARFQEDLEAHAAEAEAVVPEPAFVDAGGRRLRYLRMGPAEGVPLLLLHGFGADLNNWMFNHPALAEDRPVYALDLPGHGASTKDVGTGDVAGFAEAVRDVLDAVEIEQTHVVGHSLGGAVALALALDTPDRVDTLTLIACAGLGSEINGDFIEGFIRAGRRKQMKPVLELLVSDPALISRDMIEDVLKYKRLDGTDAALERIASANFANGHQKQSFADRLAALKPPAQVIWGREDRIIPARHAESLPAALAVHVLDGAGHMVHMEKAGEVNALIRVHAGRGQG